MSQQQPHRVIISGGGTGGHVFPAIAIADALRELEPNIDILFVGAKGKIEMEKVPKAGYPIKGLWISGFQRKLSLRNLMFPFKLVHSLFRAALIVRRFRPQVAVGVGGFASGPTLEVASRMSIPTLLQEQNSYAGITNKLLAKKAHKICVAYDRMERFFPADKLVLTGNPIREEIQNLRATREEGLKHFGLDANKQTIVLTGGSLGARSLNEAMAASASLLEQHPEVQVLWQAGKLYIDTFKESACAQLPNVQIVAFIDRMDLAYAMSEVMISRAGASTISELSAAGKTAILVPSPNVAEDHQTKNAMALVQKDAAVLIKDKEASAQMIRAALELIAEPTRREVLEQNIRQLARKDAAKHIAHEVLGLIR